MVSVVTLVRAVVAEHPEAFGPSKQADLEAEEVDQYLVTELPLQVVEEEGPCHQLTQQATSDHPHRERQIVVEEYHIVWLGHGLKLVDVVVLLMAALAHWRIAVAVRIVAVAPVVAWAVHQLVRIVAVQIDSEVARLQTEAEVVGSSVPHEEVGHSYLPVLDQHTEEASGQGEEACLDDHLRAC